MKVIIAGSRDITYYSLAERAVAAFREQALFDITEVVCGEAPRGVDQLGKTWARRNNIPVASFPADWNTHGKKAGVLRNIEMGNYADGLIAVTNGSRGTEHIIRIARSKGLLVTTLLVDPITKQVTA